MRYTYDDDDAFLSDDTSARRSARQSARTTPFEPAGPTYTASGRQVKPRQGGEYGASLLSGQATSADEMGFSGDGGREDTEDSEQPVRTGRAARAAGRSMTNGGGVSQKRKHTEGYMSTDELSDEEVAALSGEEWNSDASEEEDDDMPDADDEDEEDDNADEDEEGEVDAVDHAKSLLVTLKVSSPKTKRDLTPSTANAETGKLSQREDYDGDQASAPTHGDVSDAGVSKVEDSSTSVTNGITTVQQSNVEQPLSGYPTPKSVPAANAADKPETSANVPMHTPLGSLAH